MTAEVDPLLPRRLYLGGVTSARQILENPDETESMKYSASRLLGNIGFGGNDVDPEVIDLLI